MTEINVINTKFENTGKLKTELNLSPEVINVPVVHQVVKALLASRREGNACTKTKAEVRGGGRKPFKQKGTGRARQGSTRSPLMSGGGRAFRPKPRDYEQKVNKTIMLGAIRSVIADKLQAGKLTVIEKIESTGKTNELFKTLSGKKLLPALIVTFDKKSPALRAARNIERAKGIAVEGFSVYEAVKFENLVIEKQALEILFKRLE